MPIRHLCLQKQASLPLMNPRAYRATTMSRHAMPHGLPRSGPTSTMRPAFRFFRTPRHTVTMHALPG